MPLRIIVSLAFLIAFPAFAQAPPPPKIVAGIPVNYDESLAGGATLPNPLILANGKPVRDAKTWWDKRRPEIVHLFEEDQFGRSPGPPANSFVDVFDKGTPAFGGKAIRTQVTIYLSSDKSGPKIDLLIYRPAHASQPVPVLLNIGFSANSMIVNDPGVKEGEVWNKDNKKVPGSQGSSLAKWTSYRCSMPASVLPASITVTSSLISKAAFPMACGNSI